jgi:hypothetical protein
LQELPEPLLEKSRTPFYSPITVIIDKRQGSHKDAAIHLDKLDLERRLFLLERATRVRGTWELSKMIFQLVGNETEALLRSNPT